MMQVEQRSAEGTERLGKLTLVDLAGSEKVSKSCCVGETLEEAKKINWSLTALGKVIDALAEQRPHVPYRDSRLTRVLEEALGGNCRTTLLVAVSPMTQHYDETLSSLRFATRAKAVRNHAKVNYMYSADQLLVLVAQLQRELASANRQIAVFSGGKWPEEQSEKPKEERRKRNETTDWLRTKEGRMRLRVPLDKLPQNDDGNDEVSADLRSPSGATSCGSARSLASSETSHSEDLLPERAAPFLDDEKWRPLALAARDAMRSMEAALLAQEAVLEEAGLLRPGNSGSSSSAAGNRGSSSRAVAAEGSEQGAPESGAGMSSAGHGTRCAAAMRGDATDGRRSLGNAASTECSQEARGEGNTLDNNSLSERWRALRHAVDARSLHWRLQVERHKTETLSLELEMRKRHTEEREKDLEKLSSRLAVMLQDNTFDGKVDDLSSSVRRLLPPTRKSSGDASSSSSAPRAIRCSADSGGGPEQASSQTSARHSRIARPVPRGCSARGSRSELLQGVCEASLEPRSPLDDSGSWLQTSCRGPVAGTGEAMSSREAKPGEASSAMPPRAGSTSFDGQLERLSSAMSAKLEALQLSHGELEARVAGLQSELEDRNRQTAEIAAELGARDVRISALRHEVRVRDALLGHLHEDALRRAEHKDHEVERLVEQAMLPLTTILSSRQAATAAAINERSLLVH